MTRIERNPKDIKIGDYTLEEILKRNKHWLSEDCEKWEYMRADLRDADLRDADLPAADLSCADLSGANIRNAYLYDANLHCADLSGTDLSGTDLSGADLRGADLRDADLRCADLRCVNLSGANLSGANLRNTNSDGVNLYNVDLSFNDKLRKGIKLSEPIIGWKKCQNNVLVKLEIPRGAIVFSINNNECRTDKAKVLEIIGGNRAYSNHKFFSYYVGDIIEVFNFNCEYNVEYAEGIHFFRTRKESEEYSKF